MKKILVIYGPHDSGKTSTLKEIHKKFCENHNAKSIILNSRLKTEILRKVVVNGKSIGFASNGDDAERIKKDLNELINNGCQIIVSAVRVPDGGIQAQKAAFEEIAKSNSYEIKPFDIERVPPKENDSSKAIKTDLAQKILAELEDAIK